MRGEGGAGFGQRQALRRADEERHAEVVFKLFDLAAHRALGDVQAQGRLAEAAMPRDLFEDAQHIERGQLTHEGWLRTGLGCCVGPVYCFMVLWCLSDYWQGVDASVVWVDAFAGKPAPTVNRARSL